MDEQVSGRPVRAHTTHYDDRAIRDVLASLLERFHDLVPIRLERSTRERGTQLVQVNGVNPVQLTVLLVGAQKLHFAVVQIVQHQGPRISSSMASLSTLLSIRSRIRNLSMESHDARINSSDSQSKARTPPSAWACRKSILARTGTPSSPAIAVGIRFPPPPRSRGCPASSPYR
mgnify:CR=1 FL=1